MNNINDKNDICTIYKKQAIEATKFIDSNKYVSKVTNELFVMASKYLELIYNSFNILCSELEPNNLKSYKYYHTLHKKTCEKIFKFIKRAEIYKEKNIDFWEWCDYIYRYNNDLAIIKHLLDSSQTNIKKYKDELNKFECCKKSGNYNATTLSRDVVLSLTLSVAISLRYCLELIIFQLKNNNLKSLQNLNLNNKISFYDLLTKYEEENINFNIKDLSCENEDFIIKDFWTKDQLGSVHSKLGEMVHFQNKKHTNWNLKEYKKIEKYNDVESDINYLTKILNTIFVSMKDHNVSFERSKFNANVKDFYIDLNELFNVDKY